MLTKIKNNWQVLSVLVLLWSFFDLYFYYSNFGIDIQNYLSVSELILLVLPTILRGIAAIFVFVAFAVFLHSDKKPEFPRDQKMVEPKKYWSYIVEDFKAKKYGWAIFDIFTFLFHVASIIFCLGVLVLFIYTFFFNNGTNFFKQTGRSKYYLLTAVFLFGWFPLLATVSERLERSKIIFLQKFSVDQNPVGYVIVAFIILSVCSSQVDYTYITTGNGQKKISFIDHQQSFKSDSALVYIGSTQSYLFMRNNLDSTNLVFR